MKTLQDSISENKHLLLVSGLTFVLIYGSSFVKGYGYFIDEFYYIACAMHPAAGYVDHPPLAPLVLTLFQFVFGTSLYAIRLLPALAQSMSVFCTGRMAAEMGGGKYAQLLAASSMAAAPMVVAFGGFYSMNAFEPLLAVTLLLLTIRMIKTNEPRRWIAIGIIMGLGVMNKHTFVVFILALVCSLLVTGEWKLISNRWFVLGGLCAFLIVLPNILWQMANHYPSLEFYSNISRYKNVFTPPLAFMMGQITGMSPATMPIWLAGVVYLLVSKKTKEFRFLSVLFISLLSFMMLTGTSRSDRMIFAYPAVFAGGAMFYETLIARYNVRWLKSVIILVLFSGLAVALPVILPYFDYESVHAQVARLGLNTEIEKGKKPPLPQLLADRIGWEEKYALVLKAYQNLSNDEKKEAIIAAGNYGDAGAIGLFGKTDTLPSVVSGHNNYYLWSKERLHGSIVLRLEQEKYFGRLKELFNDVKPSEGEFSSPYVSSHENHLRVFVCRNPKIPLPEMLEKGKTYF